MTSSEAFNIDNLELLLNRATALCCVDTSSPYYGSFDRDFWAYRTIRGFQSGPFQHVMAGFAYLSQNPLIENASCHREFAESSLSQWIKQRNLNGSANEWYRNEQSFCATAMGLHAATEALLVIGKSATPQFCESASRSLALSERWLNGRTNSLATNQMVAAACGRWNLGALLEDSRMQVAAEIALKILIKDFDRHGFLSEYGGVDIGYSLISLELLVSTHRAGCDAVLPLVDRICGQIRSLLSSGGDLPFSLGSRGTQHRFFGGAHYFAAYSSEASRFVHQLKFDNWSERAKYFMSYDDRYFATFGFTAANRLLAFENHDSVNVDFAFTVPADDHVVPLQRVEVSGGTFYCNSRLGSGIQFLTDDHRSLVHLGYAVKVGGDQWCSLSVSKEDSCQGSHQFVKQSSSIPLKRFSLLFAFLQSLCRVPWIARQVSLWARVRIGRSSDLCPVFLSRSIEVTDEIVSVRDVIVSNLDSGFEQIRPLVTFPFHSPSLFNSSDISHIASLIYSEGLHLKTKSITINWSLNTRTMQVTNSIKRT
ncbi:MAG: hypothetical protein O3B03_02570 [Proteobacteria bacterium]|nr:hypothetical protein [Pseudomonadota bacterium]